MPVRKSDNKNSPYQGSPVNTVSATVGAEAANVIKVTVTLKDNARALSSQHAIFMYLSDDVAGNSIAATAPSGGWAIATHGLLIPLVTNKAAHFVSEATGVIDINITETTAKTFYLMGIVNGKVTLLATVTFA